MAALNAALALLATLAVASAGRTTIQPDHSELIRNVEAMGGLKHLENSGPLFRGLGGVTRPALQKMLELAELQFQNNLKRRARRLDDAAPKSLAYGDFEAVMLEPAYSCPVEARMGRWGEGGNWVCLSHFGTGKRDAHALSFGTGCDTDFERDLYNTLDIRTSIHDFDLSARSVDELNSLRFINFRNAGLTGSAKLESKKHRFPSVHWVTLPSAMRDAGLSFADIAKIDCEGCEIDVVKDLAASSNRTHPAVGQVLMQVHDVSEWKLPKIKGLFLTMEALGFRLFHTEVNPYYKQHYEVSFIHETLVKPRDVEQ